MITQISNKLVIGVALVLALLWTLTLGLIYALLALSDDASHWLNGLFNIPPEMGQWLLAAGTWLAQWGGWVLIVIWGFGLVGLALLAWFARRVAQWFLTSRREGGLV